MNQGAGDRLSQEYFRLIEEILKSRGLSGRELSRRIERSEGYFSRVKRRGDVAKTWKMVEEGLQISPRTLFAVLAEDVEYDQLLAAFGPQDEPQEMPFVADLDEFEELIVTSPSCRKGEVGEDVWRVLEDLERRRFRDARKVEAECHERVQSAIARDLLERDEAVAAIGALGVWSTIRRHANDRGSATKSLSLAIRVSFLLGAERLTARLLQRATYLLCDVDQFRPAEILAEKAARLYCDLGDSDGFGMALIDIGFVLFGARELRRSESRLLSGARILGSSPLHHINKAAAYHLAARASSIRGDLAQASEYLDRATRFAVSYEREWAAIRWCAGNIQFQLGNSEEAESALREALQVYLADDKVTDIVMLLLDLATVLIAQGRIDDIPPLANHLQPYLRRLPGKDQVRSHLEEAHACLLRARHVQSLERFKEIYKAARRRGFAAP